MTGSKLVIDDGIAAQPQWAFSLDKRFSRYKRQKLESIDLP